MSIYRCPICHHVLEEGEVIGWLCLNCGVQLPDNLEPEEEQG